MTRWQKELEKVRAAHKGRLHPKDVVAAARNKNSPLHSKFQWDNNKAAAAYRLLQASELIRTVTFLPEGTREPVRAYVSLSSDRLGHGGFRAMVDILSDADLIKQLLADALSELETFSLRYDKLRKVSRMKKLFQQIDATVVQRAD